MKQYPCFVLAAVALIGLPAAALAQDPPRQALAVVPVTTTSLCVKDPAAHEVADVRARVDRLPSAEGIVTLGRTATGLRLVGIASGGRILDYAVVDARGGTASTLSTLAVSQTGDDCNPCCWKCGKDGGGTVHCWQIDCPIILPNPSGDD